MPPAMVTEGTGAAAKQVSNPVHATWVVQDQAVLGGLLSSMTEDVLPQLTRIDTSNTLWTTLHAMFSAQHRGNSIQIRTQLSTARKGDMSAAEFYHIITGLADTMANIGHPLSDEEVIGYILAGLGPGHSDLFTAIAVLSNQRAVTLPEFYSYLLAHEAQTTVMNGTTEFISSVNNIVRQDSNGSRRNTNNNGHHNSNNNPRGNYRASSSNRGRGRGRGRNNGPRCQVCGIYRHIALHCRNRFNHAYQLEEYRGGNSVTTGSYNADTNWYIDTGATDHLTSDLDRLSMQERYHGKDQVQVANGAGLHISHIGQSIIPGLGRPLALRNILHVPRINKHLLSAHKFVSDNNVFIEFHADVFFVKDKATKKTLLQGKSKGGLYPIPFSRSSSITPHHASSSVKVSSSRWHQRLGHPNSIIVRSILKSNKLDCSLDRESTICDACQCAKSHQLPYNNSASVSTSPLELVHSDVWGPAQASAGGFKYYVSFLDDYSRFTWIYFIKHKSDVEQVFYNFQSHVERLLNSKILTVQTD